MQLTVKHARQQGFTVVEVLISLLLGLLIIGAVIAIFLGSKQSYLIHESLSRIQENGRYALSTLGRDIRLAGHLGEIQEYWEITESTSGSTRLPAVGGECFTAPYRWVAPFITDVDHDGSNATLSVFAPKISGSNNGLGAFAACIPAQNYVVNTDVVSVHYVGPNNVADGFRVPNQIYLRADLNHGVLYKCNSAGGTCLPDGGGSWDVETDFHYPLHAMVYYIRPCREPGGDNLCGTSDDGDQPNIPSLVRTRLQADATLITEVVADGVENMQIQFGVDNNNIGYVTQYRDANDIGNPTATSSWLAWNRVRSARVWLLARAIEPEGGYADSKTYSMGDVSVAPGDHYRRQIFSTTAAVRNYSE